MRRSQDFIGNYLRYTSEHEAPNSFHFWTAVAIIAGALRRGVWMDRGYYRLYPNLYVMFIAQSAKLRKTTAQRIGVDLLREVEGVHLINEKITPEGLINELDRTTVMDGDRIVKDGSAFVWAPEASVFIGSDPASAEKLVSFLTSIYDSPDRWDAITKTQGSANLQNVCVTCLLASAPTWLKVIPQEAVEAGFIGRYIFINASQRRKNIAWPNPKAASTGGITKEMLVEDLRAIAELKGEMVPTPRVRAEFEEWYNALPEATNDPRMTGYYDRVHDSALKLAMILSASRGDSLVVNEHHLGAAINVLREVEAGLPFATTHVGTTEHSRDAERVHRQVVRAGGRASRTELMRWNAWKLSGSELDEIIRTLAERGLVQTVAGGKHGIIYEAVSVPTPSSGSSPARPTVQT